MLEILWVSGSRNVEKSQMSPAARRTNTMAKSRADLGMGGQNREGSVGYAVSGKGGGPKQTVSLGQFDAQVIGGAFESIIVSIANRSRPCGIPIYLRP